MSYPDSEDKAIGINFHTALKVRGICMKIQAVLPSETFGNVFWITGVIYTSSDSKMANLNGRNCSWSTRGTLPVLVGRD